MKKKVLSALLCAAMAVSMLAGCGGSKSDSKEADKSATESTKAASDTFTFAIGGDTGNTLNPGWNNRLDSCRKHGCVRRW